MSDADANTQLERLLLEAQRGEESSTGELVAHMWEELRQLAGRMMKGQPAGHTLQATALVHEMYLRFSANKSLAVESRSHFMAIAARAMRQILARHAQDRRALKRGGSFARVSFSEQIDAIGAPESTVELDRALEKLARLDPRQAQVIEMRFFADMSTEEMAEVLSVSVSTVEREWRMARAWMGAELARESQS